MKKVYRWVLMFSMVLPIQLGFAQNRSITGNVTDEDGVPLAGVSVIIIGTTTGTSTDFDGNFEINANQGDKIELSYIGFETQTQDIDGLQDHFDIQMGISENVMDEVLVVAYGTASRESITGSVSSITADAFKERPTSNVFTALEGSAPGIQFNTNSGQPGSSGDIRIRGFHSINGSNSPLIVIDEVPFEGNIDDLNPEDIESISVLKDASSAALYGNRATNGVILIQTKGGKANSGTSLSVSTKQGWFSRGLPEYERLEANDWMGIMFQGYRNSLLADRDNISRKEANDLARETIVSDYLFSNIYNVPDDQLYDENGNFNSNAQILPGYLDDLDWYEGIQRTGYRQEYNLSGTASNEMGGTYYSLGYLDEEGYTKTARNKRLTARLNANYRFTDWLKVGTSVYGTHQKTNLINSGDFLHPFIFSRNMAPIYPVHLHDPETGEYVLDDLGEKQFDNGDGTRNQNVGRHVIWENELDQNRRSRNTLQGRIFAEFDFLKDFTFKVNGELNVRNQTYTTYDNPIIGDGMGNNGRGHKDTDNYKNYTVQQILNWGHSYGEHNLSALVGHESYKYWSEEITAAKSQQKFPNITDLVNYSEITSLTSSATNRRIESYFGQAKYNFSDKYFVDASFRRDGSSRFARETRWGNFWSAGASWMLSKENFLKKSWLNDLKLKVSYGEVGNDASAGTYAYQALYTISQNANQSAVWSTQNPALDLQWETSTSMNAGLEGTLFNRLNFNFEFFNQQSKDLIFAVNLPASVGNASTIDRNIGSVRNRGFEASLDVDIINTQDWNWNIGANATFMKNKVLTLPEENREEGIIDGTKKIMEGHGIYDFWTYDFIGVDQMTGQALFEIDDEAYNLNGSAPDKDPVPDEWLVDINGKSYTTNNTYGKRSYTGDSAIPDVYGSFSTNLSWKNFTLSGIFTYSLGGRIYDSTYRDMMSISGSPHALHQDILNSWDGVPEGMTETSPNRIDPDGIPIIDFSNSTYNNGMAQRWLQKGDYLNIKNITLNYSIPQNVLQKVDLKSLDVYVSAENLKTYTSLRGMNPQNSFAGTTGNEFAPYKVWTFGINIGL